MSGMVDDEIPTALTWLHGPSSPDDPATIGPPPWRSMAGRLRDVAAAEPGRIALDDGTHRLTYAALQSAIDSLVHEVAPFEASGKPVAFVVPNTIAFPVALFAALHLRCPLCLIDAADLAERKSALFEQLGAGLIVTVLGSEDDLSFVPDGVPRISFDPLRPGPTPRAIIAPEPEDGIVISFTSGSTGRPKGLARSVRSVSAFIWRRIERMGFGHDDIIASIGSPPAIGSQEALTALLTGAKLVIADMKSRGLSDALAAIREARATRLGFVPSALRIILQAPGAPEALARLRSLEVGGEPVATGDIALYRSVLPPGCPVHLSLGATETLTLFRWIVRERDFDGGSVPVGYLLPGRTVAFLDGDGRSVPAEVGGEVVVADDDVALGAWSGGELIRGLFPDAPGGLRGRFFRTGDVMRLRQDGLAEFLGRRDRMVKLGGLKADLSEVEAALRTVTGVRDAAVVPARVDGRPTLVVAFLEADDGSLAQPSDAEIRRHVVATTAPHMTPSLIRWLPRLPRLPNHKVDLVRLGALALAAADDRA